MPPGDPYGPNTDPDAEAAARAGLCAAPDVSGEFCSPWKPCCQPNASCLIYEDSKGLCWDLSEFQIPTCVAPSPADPQPSCLAGANGVYDECCWGFCEETDVTGTVPATSSARSRSGIARGAPTASSAPCSPATRGVGRTCRAATGRPAISQRATATSEARSGPRALRPRPRSRSMRRRGGARAVRALRGRTTGSGRGSDLPVRRLYAARRGRLASQRRINAVFRVPWLSSRLDRGRTPASTSSVCSSAIRVGEKHAEIARAPPVVLPAVCTHPKPDPRRCAP